MLYFYDQNLNTIPIKGYEKDDKLFIIAEIPGVKKEEISIEYKDSILKLEAKREKDEKIEADIDNLRYGKFSNTIKIYKDIDFKNSSATYENGMLTIEFPKKENSEFKLKIK